MEKIKKPKNKKDLTKVKEQWFQRGNAFRQIIDYNKVTGGSMWTKEQKADLDARGLKLNNKIDDVESRLNKKIDNVEARLNKKIDNVEARLNKKIEANTKAILENREAIEVNRKAIEKNGKAIKVLQSDVSEIKLTMNQVLKIVQELKNRKS